MVGELPHLTTEDFEEVIGVRAEMMPMEAAEQFAIAEGEKQIANYLGGRTNFRNGGSHDGDGRSDTR
jgi:hypothetical protein